MVKFDLPKPFPEKLINPCRFLKSQSPLPSRFPKYISHGQQDGRRYLILENITKPIEEYIIENENIYFDTIIKDLGMQMLDAIKQLHELGYVHRDITPNDFCMEGNKVYLTDFANVKQCRDQVKFILSESSGLEIDDISIVSCSINAHKRKTLSYRDDLESLGYILLGYLV
jgi:serine/threonine protein kinase